MGVSAALAEIYLGGLDDYFRTLSDVLLYVRYVDDIVVVFAAASNHPGVDHRRKSVRSSARELGLQLNASKTRYIELKKGRVKTARFAFLGYEFSCEPQTVSVDISERRHQKMQHRLETSFERYRTVGHVNRSPYLLRNRIRFLTGNTRLAHNKRHAVVGIYFSNSLLSGPTKRIRDLDQRLDELIASTPMPKPLSDELSSLGFADGYQTKRFHKFSGRELRRIVAAWKHA
jgi:HAMP domain-containing protein